MRKNKNQPPEGPSSNAPGQFLGYSLQITRCLARILEVPAGSFVSVEVFDDVGVTTPDGTQTFEQDKSARSGNPIADRSPDLWKTFANWITAAKSKTYDPAKTYFELYVSKPLDGDITREFSLATTLTDAKAALAKTKDRLWGAAPQYPKKSGVAKTLAPYLEKVFDADPDLVSMIICKFSVQCGSGSAHDDLRAAPALSIVPPELKDDTLKFALGSIKETIDRHIEQGEPALLAVDKVRQDIMSFVRKNDRRTILRAFSSAPSKAEVARDIGTRTYVRQLEIIESDYDDIIHAVNTFLRAATDRTHWSEKGLVQSSSFDEFEENLRQTWRSLRQRCAIEHKAKTEAERGKLLYHDCCLHNAPLEGLTVPSHFTPGSFHKLSDAKEIGWHPDYTNKLDGLPPKKPSET